MLSIQAKLKKQNGDLIVAQQQEVSKIKKMKKKRQVERDEWKEKFDKVVEKMRQQSEEYRLVDHEKTNEIARLQEVHLELDQKKSDLEITIQRLERKLANLQEEKERERKFVDSQTIAKIKAVETEFAGRIEAAKAENEVGKRQVVDMIIQQLSTICGPANSIEECIFAIRKKLETVQSREARIRGFLQIGPLESIEDFLMNHYR